MSMSDNTRTSWWAWPVWTLNDPGCIEQLEHAVKNFGFRALKLSGAYQDFNPADPCHDPLYRKAQELDIPIFWHQSHDPLCDFPLALVETRSPGPGRPTVPETAPDDLPHRAPLAHRCSDDRSQAQKRLCRHVGFRLPPLALLPGTGHCHRIRCGPQDTLRLGLSLCRSRRQRPLLSTTRPAWPQRAGLPPIPEAYIEDMLERDSLKLLGMA